MPSLPFFIVMLNIITLTGVMLNVVMTSVVAPFKAALSLSSSLAKHNQLFGSNFHHARLLSIVQNSHPILIFSNGAPMGK
jgi:hypothetical protein